MDTLMRPCLVVVTLHALLMPLLSHADIGAFTESDWSWKGVR
jgi:hypothetical protein